MNYFGHEKSETTVCHPIDHMAQFLIQKVCNNSELMFTLLTMLSMAKGVNIPVWFYRVDKKLFVKADLAIFTWYIWV